MWTDRPRNGRTLRRVVRRLTARTVAVGLTLWGLGVLGTGPASAQTDGGPPSPAVAARVGTVRADLLRAGLDKLTGVADIAVGDGGTGRIRSRSVRHPDIKVAEDYLFAELTALGLQVRRLPFAFAPAAAPLANLEATLVGTTAPTEIYLLAAHYDSTARLTRGHVEASDAAPGADDDGTGVVLLLEAARVLKDSQPRATVRFLLFSAEEEGLFGSDAYAKAARERGDDLRFVLSLDPVGNTGPLGGNLYFTYDHASEGLAHFAVEVRERYSIALPVLIVPGDSPLYPDDRSDHRSFWAAGYQGLHGGSLPGDTYHTVLDTADKVDFAFLTDATRVVVAMLGDAAGPVVAPPVVAAPQSRGASGCAVGDRVGDAGAGGFYGAVLLALAVWVGGSRRRRRREQSGRASAAGNTA